VQETVIIKNTLRCMDDFFLVQISTKVSVIKSCFHHEMFIFRWIHILGKYETSFAMKISEFDGFAQLKLFNTLTLVFHCWF